MQSCTEELDDQILLGVRVFGRPTAAVSTQKYLLRLAPTGRGQQGVGSTIAAAPKDQGLHGFGRLSDAASTVRANSVDKGLADQLLFLRAGTLKKPQNNCGCEHTKGQGLQGSVRNEL